MDNKVALNDKKSLAEKKFEGISKIIFYSIPVTLLSVIAFYTIHFYKHPIGQPEDFGVFGDFIGGLFNPFLSMGAVVLLVFSIRFQLDELKLTRAEMESSSDALQSQYEVMVAEYNSNEIRESFKEFLATFQALSSKLVVEDQGMVFLIPNNSMEGSDRVKSLEDVLKRKQMEVYNSGSYVKTQLDVELKTYQVIFELLLLKECLSQLLIAAIKHRVEREWTKYHLTLLIKNTQFLDLYIDHGNKPSERFLDTVRKKIPEGREYQYWRDFLDAYPHYVLGVGEIRLNVDYDKYQWIK